MEIDVLFTLLLISLLLGGLFLWVGKVCLMDLKQINVWQDGKFNLEDGLLWWAVKLVGNTFYLLNIVALVDALNSSDTTLIQPQNSIFVG